MSDNSKSLNSFFSKNGNLEQALHLPSSFSNREMIILHLRPQMKDYHAMQMMRRFLYQQHAFNVSRMDDHAVIEAIATHLMKQSFARRSDEHLGQGKVITSPEPSAASAQITTQTSSTQNKPAKIIDSSQPPARQPEPVRKPAPSTAAPTALFPKADQPTPSTSPSTSSSAMPENTGIPDISLPIAAATSVSPAAIPSPTVPSKKPDKKKTLTLRWMQKEAYCGDLVQLIGEGTGLDEGASATVEIIHPENGTLARLEGNTTTTFPNTKEAPFAWEVKDVVFSGANAPTHYDLTAKISASGLTAVTESPLQVKRIPDIPTECITLTYTRVYPNPMNSDNPITDNKVKFEAITKLLETSKPTSPSDTIAESPLDYAIETDRILISHPIPEPILQQITTIVTESKLYITHKKNQLIINCPPDRIQINNGIYEKKRQTQLYVRLEGDQLYITKPIQFIKAWSAKTICMEVRGRYDIFLVKKVGTGWMYYDANFNDGSWKSPEDGQWCPLPDDISTETIENNLIVDKGGYYGLENYAPRWPDTPKVLPAHIERINQWIDLIHFVWDDRFELHHSPCPSTKNECCSWRIRISARAEHGEKSHWGDRVHAVITDEKLRSHSTCWYISDDDLLLAPHEFGHHLGLPDEYRWEDNAAFNEEQPYWERNASYDHGQAGSDTDSIMNSPSPRVYPRHMKQIAEQVETLMLEKTGRKLSLDVREGYRYNDHVECPGCGKWMWPANLKGFADWGILAEDQGTLCSDCSMRNAMPYFEFRV